jgi:hypothetical protein
MLYHWESSIYILILCFRTRIMSCVLVNSEPFLTNDPPVDTNRIIPVIFNLIGLTNMW